MDFRSHSEGGEAPPAQRVDARGVPCPLPILALAKAVRGRRPGQVIELCATDPAVEADLAAWCQSTGHELLSVRRDGELWVGRVRLRG
jgi:tRNA 2-thiouridine synthesizing protein A